jgi:hypothetical protein
MTTHIGQQKQMKIFFFWVVADEDYYYGYYPPIQHKSSWMTLETRNILKWKVLDSTFKSLLIDTQFFYSEFKIIKSLIWTYYYIPRNTALEFVQFSF